MILALDLDGVVVLGHPDGGRWDKNLLLDLGMDATRLQNLFFKPHFERIVCGEAELGMILRSVWPDLQCRHRLEEFVAYWFAMDSRVNEALLERVDAWRGSGNRAFLATNQEHLRAKYIWADLSLSSRFDGLIYSAALGARKPDQTFFHRALTNLPVTEGREVLFLDDSKANVEAAAAAGWNSFLYTGIESFDAALTAHRSSG